MALIPLRPLMEAAERNHFAYGAFNVNAVAQAEAVIEIHDALRSAAILQGADLANAFMGGRADFKKGTIEDKIKGAKRIADAVRETSAKHDIPVVMHLDHGRDFSSCKAAIDGGYTSVMIDGSSLSFEENIELTREVVRYAHDRGVTVEGELGVLAGVEDDVFSDASTYTNPLLVCEFFQKTHVDCLAISYGTKHGAVKGTNIKLRQEIVIASKENIRHAGITGYLVSHGSSTVPRQMVEQINSLGGAILNAKGIPLDQLCDVIPYGVRKINVDTDIRLAITRNLREFFDQNPAYKENAEYGEIWALMCKDPAEFDPRAYLTPVHALLMNGKMETKADMTALLQCVKKGVWEAVGTLIVRFGSAGSAPLVKQTSLEEMAEVYRKEGV